MSTDAQTPEEEEELTPEQKQLKDIEEWTFPQEVRLGDRVLFSPSVHDMTSQARGRTLPGVIVRVDQRTVDVGLLGNAYMPRESCRHVDDPALILRPHLVSEPHTGVFRLTDAELEQRRLIRRMDALEQSLTRRGSDIPQEYLKARVCDVDIPDEVPDEIVADGSHTAKTLPDSTPQKRGPGRPRKNPIPPE